MMDQGFWTGSLPAIGYRIVEAPEQRGHRTKKTLQIDPMKQVKNAPLIGASLSLITRSPYCI
jgi:site-specific DNA recombinase